MLPSLEGGSSFERGERAPRLIFSVGTHGQFLDDPNEKVRKVAAGLDVDDADNVDYFGNQAELVAKGFWKGGLASYVISPINSRDKYSHGYEECTGIVATGRDRVSGENVSFLSHQRPTHILNKPREFLRNLEMALSEIKEVAEEGSVDAVILGGAYPNALLREDFRVYAKHMEMEYKLSIEMLSSAIQRNLSLTPAVAGPKIAAIIDSVFLDNAKQRICLMRRAAEGEEDQVFQAGIFSAAALTEEEEKWKKD